MAHEVDKVTMLGVRLIFFKIMCLSRKFREVGARDIRIYTTALVIPVAST